MNLKCLNVADGDFLTRVSMRSLQSAILLYQFHLTIPPVVVLYLNECIIVKLFPMSDESSLQFSYSSLHTKLQQEGAVNSGGPRKK